MHEESQQPRSPEPPDQPPGDAPSARPGVIDRLLYQPIVGAPSLLPRSGKNPDFHLGSDALADAIAGMLAKKIPLQRPVLLLAGWRSPEFGGRVLASRLAELTCGDLDQFWPLAYPMRGDLKRIASMVAVKVHDRWPGEGRETIPIDVVGHSMGGLVARLAASPNRQGPRLQIKRLFTLATPHRGARLATKIAPDPAARDMKPGSALLKRLDEELEHNPFELIPYAHCHDTWVGAHNTAPPGRDPFWTPGTWVFSHFSIHEDRLIQADIARRLRGEKPIAKKATPPPTD
ncbi:MAG: hypothetical protein EA423_06000 [Phycisphaerales bacterium]|nr:MAG: hypothetical protein EA423_06000 [Phycisphaerales bacterium]